MHSVFVKIRALCLAQMILMDSNIYCHALLTIRAQSADEDYGNKTEHVPISDRLSPEYDSFKSPYVLFQNSSSSRRIMVSILSEKEEVDSSSSYQLSDVDDIKIHVDGERHEESFDHIWRSTGLCPPDPHSKAHSFLLSQDELQNLALIGSLPNNAISQVRIHWLLDLVNARLDDKGPRYNYKHLDTLMDYLREFNLKPGFEIMGNPGNIFTDFENITQVNWWRHLVAQTARRYVDKYGLEWVSSWNWETWNEPDHHDFDSLNITLKGFLNYYDACRMGLDDVSPSIKFGGPGGSCRDPHFSKICWALLEHCNNGSSIFTPGVPPRIDFISFHRKGQQDADTILKKELPIISKIYNQYPSLRQVPVMNDEADFEVGWSKGREWRADGRYAALAVRSIYIHQQAKSSIPNFRYSLMSFDNAFLNYRPSFFDQRTILTRFQINNTTPHQVHFVKKPAYTIMGLLSLLGDQMLSYTESLLDERLSVLSTCRNCAVANSADPVSPREAKTPSDAAGTIGIDNQSPRLTGKRGTFGEEDSPLATGSSKLSDYTEELGDIPSHDHDPATRSFFSEIQSSTTSSGEFPKVPKGHSDEGEHLIDSPSSGEEGRLQAKVTSPYQMKNSKTTKANEPSGRRAAAAAWEATLVISSSNGSEKNEEDFVKVRVSFALPRSLVGKNLYMATYRLRADVKGPYEAWLDLGSPIEPNRTELSFIRSFEGAIRDGPQLLQAVPPYINYKANLTLPDVLFIHICEPDHSSPGQVTNVNIISISGADILITWSDDLITTRCVWYYEVQRSQHDRNGPYWTISNQNVTDNNFIYSLSDEPGRATVNGWYRVRVLTYWGSTGPFSDPVRHAT